MNKLYLLLISFFLIFNLSCDDDDYPTTFEDDSTYNLTWNYSISGGTGGTIDYADNNALEISNIQIILTEITSDGTSLKKEDGSIKFEIILDGSEDLNNMPSLDGLDSGNNASTNVDGEITLIWNDAGYVGLVNIDCEYTDSNGTKWSPDEMSSFTMHSIYEKVTDLVAINKVFENVSLSAGQDENGTVSVLVKESSSPVAGANVYLNSFDDEGNEITYEYFSFLEGQTAISDEFGLANFNCRLFGGSSLTAALSSASNNTIVLDMLAYVQDENLSLIDECPEDTPECDLDLLNDFNNDGITDKQVAVTITIIGETISVDDTYNSIDLISLDLNPSTLIFNDIPSDGTGSDSGDTDGGDGDEGSDENNDESGDTSTNNDSVLLEATIRGADGSPISGIPVYFENTTSFGTFTGNNILSGQDGISQNTLQNVAIESNSTEIQNIEITASVINPSITDPLDENYLIATDTGTIQVGYQSAFNINQVVTLTTARVQNIDTQNNSTIEYSYILKAWVTDSSGAPVENVPINFDVQEVMIQLYDEEGNPLLDEEYNPVIITVMIGTISNNLVWSDANGYAEVIYSLNEGDLITYEGYEIDAVVQISISNQFTTSESWTMSIVGSPNIENEVNEFNYYSTLLPNQPPETITMITGDTLMLPFIAKNEHGIRISGVPVQYEIFGSSSPIRSYGDLSTPLSYTCCGDDTTFTLQDIDGNGFASQEENLGIATTNYTNIINQAITVDSIRAFIIHPTTNGVLFTDSVYVRVTPPNTLVDGLFAYAIPQTIYMDTMDSVYCDTITTIASDSSGQSLYGVDILYSLNSLDQTFGYISDYATVTDTIPGEGFWGARTTFCTFPNISLDVCDWNKDICLSTNDNCMDFDEVNCPAEDGCSWNGAYCINVEIQEDCINISDEETCELSVITIDIDISAPGTDPVLTEGVEIYLIEDFPECPNCEASLELVAQYYELPAGDENDIFTSLVTATVIDSTENPVPENTLVQFQSLTENEDGDLVQIGSIEPYKFTNSSGIATATFNQETDAGLAMIIATSPTFNLADTIYFNLTSTDATSMELVDPYPNEIMVQGGGGVEATELPVLIKDGTGNLVTEPFLVHFEILPSAPVGVYFNEHDDNDYVECAESSNGVATVTLNSGTQPGSVPIRAELYTLDFKVCSNNNSPCSSDKDCPSGTCDEVDCDDINSNIYDNNGIAELEAVPVTVVTGPPEFGQINYSYVDITPIGGGLYDVPLSVNLWDFYSNPVADSTNVYIWIEGLADAYNPEIEYVYNDTMKWGDIDINGNIIEVDSLLYVWNHETLTDDVVGNLLPSDGAVINGSPIWLPVPHPASIIGEAKTGMEGPDGQSYSGVAWSNVHYGTSNIFDNTVIKALTYNSDGEKLIIDSRDSHNGEGLVLPFQPGALAVSSSIQFWNFSVFGDVGLNDLDDTVAVTIGANLTDYYQYPVDNGTVLLSAPGANIWFVCDPEDTDGDGYVGECWEDVDLDGIITPPPFGATDQINTDLGTTCTVCGGNGGFWLYDDSNTGEFNALDGDGIIDDDAAYGKTNGNGQIIWFISYSEALNPGDGDNPETYEDFTSTVTLQLLDPLQTASDGVDILLIKSELNDNP